MAASGAGLGRESTELEKSSIRRHIAWIVASGVFLRIFFLLAYKPIWAGDSPSYSLEYYFWAHHQFYLGERTPVYPLFLGLVQWVLRQPASILPSIAVVNTVVILQCIADLAVCVGFYFTLRWLRVSERIALVASIFLVTLPALGLHEMYILNMSPAFALVTAAATVYIALLRRIDSGKPFAWMAVGLGVLFGIVVLNRPEFLVLAAVVILGTVILRFRCDAPKLLSAALLMIVGMAPLVFAWMALMYAGVGEFRITTLDGWNKSRTVYNLFDRVPSEDRALGEVLTRSYRVQLAHRDEVNLREHMFVAFDELKAHYSEFPIDHSVALRPSAGNLEAARLAYQWIGLQRVSCALSNQLNCYENMRARIDLGDYIGDVSGKLIRRYPGAWLKNVVIDWLSESFNYSYVDRKEAVYGFRFMAVDGSTFVRSAALDPMITWAVRIEAPLLTICYVCALGLSVLGIVRLFAKANAFSVTAWGVILLAVGGVTTIAVMCAIAGFNRIYHLPLLGIFVLCTAEVAARRLGNSQVSS